MRIVLICFDSLSDWIFTRFIEENPTSFIARMVKNGLRFKNNYTGCTFSHPSYPSILFGVYPHEHGILAASGYKLNASSRLTSIHHELCLRGWKCTSVSDIAWLFSGTYGYNLSPVSGALDYDTSKPDRDKTFIFLNYWGCHYPHVLKWSPWPPMEGWTEMYNLIEKKDTQGVERLREEWVCRIINNLKFYSKRIEKFDKPDTIIILCSDHGDDFGLHDSVLHTDSLPWDSVAKVPFVVYPDPGCERGDFLTSNVDIKRTILDIAEHGEIKIPEHEHVILTGGLHKQTKNAIRSCGFIDRDGCKYIRTGDGEEYFFPVGLDNKERQSIFNMTPEASGNFYSLYVHEIRELKRNYPFLFHGKRYEEHLKQAEADNDRFIEEQLKGLGYL